MDKPKQVCWNCCYCDTFGGVCLKGKFVDMFNPVILSIYSCEEFDDRDLFVVMSDEINELKQENTILFAKLDKLSKENMILQKSNDMLEQENNKINKFNNQLIEQKHKLLMELEESTKLLERIRYVHPNVFGFTIDNQIDLNKRLIPKI